MLFAHGSGSGRLSPRNNFVARELERAGLGTLLFDLLTPEEAADRRNVFDIDLLAGRLALATDWLCERIETREAPMGYFGASTGAAAALRRPFVGGGEITSAMRNWVGRKRKRR